RLGCPKCGRAYVPGTRFPSLSRLSIAEEADHQLAFEVAGGGPLFAEARWRLCLAAIRALSAGGALVAATWFLGVRSEWSILSGLVLLLCLLSFFGCLRTFRKRRDGITRLSVTRDEVVVARNSLEDGNDDVQEGSLDERSAAAVNPVMPR